MKTLASLSTILCLSFTFGCDVPEMEVGEPSPTPPASASQDDGKLFGKADWYLPDGRVDMSGVAGEPPMTTGTPREITWKDPKQGKLTRRDGGGFGKAGLNAAAKLKNQPLFDSITHALNLYWAEHGEYPQSHTEFLKKIVEFNKLNLPTLEPGDAYLYDPEDHLLKIFRPGDPGAPQVEGVVAYEKKAEEEE